MTPPRCIRVSKRVDLPRRPSIRRPEADLFSSIPTPYCSHGDPSSLNAGSPVSDAPAELTASSDPVQETVGAIKGAPEHDVDPPKPGPMVRSVSHKTHRRSQYIFIG
jgi:hypothetical protein